MGALFLTEDHVRDLLDVYRGNRGDLGNRRDEVRARDAARLVFRQAC